ncbi:MAG: hypothetical protein U0263_09940 [Polyangiaceae bacterium]
MRVTDALRYESVRRALQGAAQKHAEAARQASSGSRLESPANDPVAAADLARVSAQKQRVDTQRKTVASVAGDLGLAEAALAESSDLLARAKELAMQGANGSLSASERSVLAKQVGELRSALAALGNTKGARGYLFAGSQTANPPFSTAGAFSGDDQEFVVDVGSGPTGVGASGAQAFTTAGGRDVFQDLTALESALNLNDPVQVAATLDHLEADRAQIGEERGRIGLKQEKLDTSDLLLEDASLSFAESAEKIGSADPFEAFSRMTELAQTLERSVAVSKQLLDLGSLWR